MTALAAPDTATKVRVFLADDHAIFREGVRRILAAAPEFEVVGEAGSVDELLEAARTSDEAWQLLVLDLSMPGGGGLEALQRIRPLVPELRILVLSMYPATMYESRAQRAGADGYVCKERTGEELLDAVRTVATGESYFVLSREAAAGPLPHEHLSTREYQVFVLAAQGYASSKIAIELSLAPSTVSTHLNRIKKRLDVTTTGEVVRYAARHGLV